MPSSSRPRARRKSRISESATIRHEIADRAIEVEVVFNLAFRVVSMQGAGLVPNYEASMLQMSVFETIQRTARTAAKALGLYGQLWGGGDGYSPLEGEPAKAYVPLGLAHDRGRQQRDSAQHHRHARPRPASRLTSGAC